MSGFKKAAEELLKIADEIEKDAGEVTQFVCDKCNHTASLAKINEMRRQAATEIQAEGEVVATDITVNDKLQCPACDGVMAYRETEASKSYYFDPDKTAKDEAPAATPDSKPEGTETPADEAAESRTTQDAEKAQGTEQHAQPEGEGTKKTAKVDYDSLRRYASK